MFLSFTDFLKENKAMIMIISMIVLFIGLVAMLIIYFVKQSKTKIEKI